jgi:hypothetical protein
MQVEIACQDLKDPTFLYDILCGLAHTDHDLNSAISSNRNELMNKYERFQKALDIAKQALV